MMKSTANHALHFVTEAVLGIAGLIAIAGCVLAWRLAQGPIDVTGLAQREQAALTGADVRLSVGHAVLVWEGFHDPTSPLDLRVTDIRVAAADGNLLLRLPNGRVTLSVAQLLLGRVVPRRIEIDNAVVDLRRSADGALTLDLNNQPNESAASSQGGNRIMSELARPARTSLDRQPDLPFLRQLRHVLIRRAHVTLHDAALGVVWQAQDATADLTRRDDGGVSGDASLALAVGTVQAKLTAHAELTGDGTKITASTTDVTPAALAALSPAFASLGMLDAPLRTTLEASVAPDLTPRTLHLVASLGAGHIHAGRGAIPIQSATAELNATPTHANLHDARLAFAALPGKSGAPPALTLTADVERFPGRITANFAADIDQVALGDLPDYWPVGTGGGSRDWIVQNLTAGTARAGHAAGTIEAASDFSTMTLKTLSGGLTGDDLTIWWLRPVPPLQHANARLVIDSPDALRIVMTSGQQKALRLTSGTMRITGLTAKDQFGQIDVGMQGALPDALALLSQPRLNLLSRLPFPVENPAGNVTAHIGVHLPLDNRITMDDIGISAETELADVHLGKVAAGRDLDDGQLTLNVDTNGLVLAGDATFAGIPSSLKLDMDFRGGAADTNCATGECLWHCGWRGFGAGRSLPRDTLTAGTAALDLTYTAHRDSTATLAVSADLRRAAIHSPFAWAKAAGEPASADLRLSLRGGHITGIDTLRAEGPGLKITSSVSTENGRMHVLNLDRIQLGRTDLHGAVTLPAMDTDPWRVKLSGPMLDLSDYLATKSTSTTDTADDETRGPPWSVALNVGHVVLAKDESVSSLNMSAASDGQHISRARLNADAGRITAGITPVGTSRHLAVDAADAGAVLLAANVFDNIRGGHLHVDADYNDALPHSPLAGTATLETFRLLDAPAIGRLLKAMTFYGRCRFVTRTRAGFCEGRGAIHVAAAGADTKERPCLLRLAGDNGARQHRFALSYSRSNRHNCSGVFFQSVARQHPGAGQIIQSGKGQWRICGALFGEGQTGRPKHWSQPALSVDTGIAAQCFLGCCSRRQTQC